MSAKAVAAVEPSIEPVQRFGTFLGVFTPSVLTILGLIMYLRFGWVVGNVGLPLTLLMVFLASSVTFITALSASALATNMRVGVGGEYFMVARSLGLELGGTIGIPLFSVARSASPSTPTAWRRRSSGRGLRPVERLRRSWCRRSRPSRSC